MFEKIAVATDGSTVANKAVDAAADLAVKYGAELTILHVLMHGEPPQSLRRMAEVEHLAEHKPEIREAFDNMPGQMVTAQADIEKHRFDHDVIASMGEAVAQRAQQRARQAGVGTVDHETLVGDTAEQIVTAADRRGADLIVIGSRGLGPFQRLLMGSVSHKVSQIAGSACLIVR
ncbi:MAG: universal stress protein [Magnetovibrio sp.]|nr:universal stress protein [Magnetovibrio sp.]